jgi:hypothetical protein
MFSERKVTQLEKYKTEHNKHNDMQYQYSETSVMHFLFNLLRIKGLYMFRALLAHPQGVMRKKQLCIACVLCQLAAAT